jgi:uncharacterized coiled-coil protein SlyX
MTNIPYESMTKEQLEQEIDMLEFQLSFEDYYAIDVDDDALAMHKSWQDKINSNIKKLQDLLKTKTKDLDKSK